MDTINNSNQKNNEKSEASFSSLASLLLSVLPERSAEIVRKRFGLNGKKPETLEKIGTEHSITRERVRQIIFEAMKKISKNGGNPAYAEANRRIAFAIEKNDGIIKETDLISALGGGMAKEANAVSFFCFSSDKVESFEEDKRVEKSWIISKDVVAKVKEVEAAALEIFQKERKLLSDEEAVQKISVKISGFSKKQALNYLRTLIRIKRNKFGKWGVSSWEEVSPKGTREKIYLVLKEKGIPLHFSEIARLIDEYGLSKKKAHPQTVHNELIKDDKFILIGRGIYALKEWGYQSGTVRDVLEEILKKSGKPLTKDEVLEKALQVRKVKRATVMINLNDSKFFARNNDKYSVKK